MIKASSIIESILSIFRVDERNFANLEEVVLTTSHK